MEHADLGRDHPGRKRLGPEPLELLFDRAKLTAAACAGERLDPALATWVPVIEYEIPDRDHDGSGELIALITTITDPVAASAQLPPAR